MERLTDFPFHTSFLKKVFENMLYGREEEL
jgi:hypothetical protein